MNWKDNFSKQAGSYAKYRPQYPSHLYHFLMTLVENKRVAWDCGTGNGQVARCLAAVFERVIATDASASQLAYAQPLPNIEYRVAPAEESGLSSSSIDLITVAQAVHWFNFERFYSEVRRVAHHETVIAVWGYGLLQISASLDEILFHLYTEMLGRYWDAERKHLDEAYQTIPFPFQEMITPAFKMQASWYLADLIGYLNTWSSLQKFIVAENYNPLEAIEADLRKSWGDLNQPKTINWDIYLKVGKVN